LGRFSVPRLGGGTVPDPWDGFLSQTLGTVLYIQYPYFVPDLWDAVKYDVPEVWDKIGVLDI
jgi:hypothetical protein